MAHLSRAGFQRRRCSSDPPEAGRVPEESGKLRLYHRLSGSLHFEALQQLTLPWRPRPDRSILVPYMIRCWVRRAYE